MQILSHRGYWLQTEEKNTKQAFQRSFENGFGLETDIRDCYFDSSLMKITNNDKNDLVISHDIANPSCLKFSDFLALYKQYSTNLPLALNIKADGLQVLLKNLLEKYEISNYFVFDMSIPDALIYLNLGFKVFTRQSEYEKEPSFYDQACGIWLDEFQTHWINEDIIKKHLDNGKIICIVSPELHKRDYEKEWQEYKKINEKFKTDKLMLCTDYPKKAKEFFNV